ncbi:putative calcium-binding protein [Vitis vinifera]|uniref:Putative calcium-binding protein n=1 Tax=Vitis vinifera TaxID=29760 RepID=A0A438HQB9_VITVI|nr:putative calcium-binding protein [Vitis vinifera]
MDVPSEEFQDPDHQSFGSNTVGCVSCTTFNILAPIYKRLSNKRCESEFREFWRRRNESILDRLLHLKSSIICLQEFWVGNEDLVSMYEKRLGDAGYVTYKLARTNNRGDGLLTAVNKNQFRVLNSREFLFHDIADRVALLLHVELLVCFPQNQSADIKKEALIVNTHLIFPHDSSYCFLRLQQVYMILQYIESYCDEHQLPSVPIILCGDWNGSNKGHVYKFLCSQGFVSSYDIAHNYMDIDEDSHKWISHRNHRGNVCGVDFIWLLNPNKHRKPLKESFMEALLGNITNLLQKASTGSVDPLHFFEMDGSYITYSQFCQALAKLGVCGSSHSDLCNEDTKKLWEHLDTDRNGVIDLLQYSRAENLYPLLLQKEDTEENGGQIKEMFNTSTSTTMIGFNVKNAMLFPPEVEKGMWPENYSLSDHAHLTVEFSLVEMNCT